MLIHIRPIVSYGRKQVVLIDPAVEPFGHLSGKADLASRRPHRNPEYTVACRRRGRRAIDGILIEAPDPVSEFTTVARWAVMADFVATHRITFSILDQDFGAVSDDPRLWKEAPEDQGGLPSRWPTWAKDFEPQHIQAVLDTDLFNLREPSCEGRFNRKGRLAERRETLAIPTIERGRVLHPSLAGEKRMPALESAFIVSAISSGVESKGHPCRGSRRLSWIPAEVPPQAGYLDVTVVSPVNVRLRGLCLDVASGDARHRGPPKRFGTEAS